MHAFGSPAGPRRRDGAEPAGSAEPDRVAAGRHHVPDRSWLGLAERVVHPWPLPVRLAALVLVLATDTATAAVAVVLVGQLAVAGLGLRVRRRHRRHMRDLRRRLAATRRVRAA